MTQVKSLVDAIDSFITGCKSDGTWDAIKSCCIMAAWDGLPGALVPLKGTAPTNYNFVSGDYNRKTGLVGDGSTKYLDSNRNNNDDPQNNQHMSVYVATAQTAGDNGVYIHSNGRGTGASGFGRSASIPTQIFCRIRSSIADYTFGGDSTGFIGISRSSSSTFGERDSTITATFSRTSEASLNANVFVFAHDANTTNARLAFYSIGESLDLALLDARVTDLINAIGAAIP